MSSPPNPLDAYRTYSYHHILLVADSTATATSLSNEPDLELSAFDHPDVKFCPKQAPNGGNYIVLINGMTDAQFFIKSAKWASVIVPSSGLSSDSPAQSSTTMAVDGEMVVMEPQGLNFMNLLNECTKMMKIDPTTMTFVLKTVFIGHRDDGTQRYINNVKPLMFMMVDITAAIDISGAEYTLGLVGIANGAAKMPHMTSTASGFDYTVKQADIKEVMADLSEELNNLYGRQRRKLQEDMNNCGVGINLGNEFSRVLYNIEAPDYANYPMGDLQDGKFTVSGNMNVTQLSSGSSIENIIAAVMNSSKKVVDEANAEPPNRFIYKITSDVETSPSLVKVNYYVHRYQASVIDVEKFLTFEPPKGEGIEFDYIFTGANIDIINFDLRMQMGLVFFQVLAAQSTSPTTSQQLLNFYNPDKFVGGIGAKDGAGDQQEESNICDSSAGEKKMKPLFLGTSMQNPMFRDTKAIGPSTGFGTMLQRHAAIENLEAKMTIRGNPQLLADTTPLPSDIRAVDPTEASVIDPGEGVPGLRTLMPAPHKTPSYVKVRVHAPKATITKDGKATGWVGASRTPEERAAAHDGDYAENMWYPGWYILLQIDNVFDEGEFTQELTMISLPVDSGESKLSVCQETAPTKQNPSNKTPEQPADATPEEESSSRTEPAVVNGQDSNGNAEERSQREADAARAAKARTGQMSRNNRRRSRSNAGG